MWTAKRPGSRNPMVTGQARGGVLVLPFEGWMLAIPEQSHNGSHCRLLLSSKPKCPPRVLFCSPSVCATAWVSTSMHHRLP